jgi:hypothetical protein
MGSARAARPSGRVIAAIVACAGLIVAACGPSASEAATARPSVQVPSPARTDSGTQPGAPSSAAAPYVPTDSVEAIDKRLAVVLDGTTTYIKNGGRVVLGDGLTAEIYLDPYPPSDLRSTMDVYLTRDGVALADGGVEIAYEMLAMAHGPFSAEAKKIGGGHYLIPLDYIMFGPWEQVVTFRIGLQRIHIPVLVVAYP